MPKLMPKSWTYDQNGSPNRSQIDEKSRLRRGCVFGVAFGTKGGARVRWKHRFWRPFSIKNEKRHPKKHLKIDAEKILKMYAKRFPKWCQNGHQKHWFFILFRKRRKRSRPFVFPHNSWFWALKMRVKSIRNQHKNRRRAKSKENGTKMEPKWEPKSMQNLKKAWKKACRKWCRNLTVSYTHLTLPTT